MNPFCASIRAAALIAGIATTMSVPAGAQWLNYPVAGVPKTPSGTPNLGAPAPRTADGKPDLSGIWEYENTLPCNPNDAGANCSDLAIGAQFVNIAAGMKEGLPYQPSAAALVKARGAAQGKDDPASRCLPAGVPRLDAIPTMKKMVQVPGLVVILDEYNASYRQIFTDGRPLPEDPQPSWNGYSTAKWDGDTLVVETIGLRDGLWLDAIGDPLTDAAKITERFHRVNYGNLEIELTVNDPQAYKTPWTVKLHQYLVINTDLIDYICAENEKDHSHMVVSASAKPAK